MFDGIKEISITAAATARKVPIVRVPDNLRAPASLVLPQTFHPNLIITLHSIATKAADVMARDGLQEPAPEVLAAAADLTVARFSPRADAGWAAPTEPEQYNRLLTLAAITLLQADALARKLDREACATVNVDYPCDMEAPR